MTDAKRKQLIANLEKALRYVRKYPPKRCTREYTRWLAFKFCVNRKTMATALNMAAQEGK